MVSRASRKAASGRRTPKPRGGFIEAQIALRNPADFQQHRRNSGVGCVFCMNWREYFESKCFLVPSEKRRQAAALQSLAEVLSRHKLDDGSKADKPLPGNLARHDRFVKESNRKKKHLFVARRIKAGDGSQS
jgi:hypothetical protein